jgi:hypothetical protein
MYHFCTYFDIHYAARGLALYRSLERWLTDFTLSILCFDDATFEVLSRLELENARLIRRDALEQSDPELHATRLERSRIEYYFTSTPSLPLYILDRQPDVGTITYLDADLFFFGDPTIACEELGQGSVLLTPHRFPEWLKHREVYGRFNVGLLSFRNDETGLAALRWWRKKAIEWCYDRVEPGRFAEQKYLDEMHERFTGVFVMENASAGLAPWNWMNHSLTSNGEVILVDQDPLVFYHFHGLKVLTPWLYDLQLRFYRPMPGHLKRMLYGPYLRALRCAASEISGLRLQLREDRAGLDRSGYSARDFLSALKWNDVLIWTRSFAW